MNNTALMCAIIAMNNAPSNGESADPYTVGVVLAVLLIIGVLVAVFVWFLEKLGWV